MPFLNRTIDFFLNFDSRLDLLFQNHDVGTYVVLSIIILLETALLFASFLPGDSLLFIAGTFASRGSIDLVPAIMILIVSAFIGNTANFGIGSWLGPKFMHNKNARLFKKERLEKAHAFYERYGGITIIAACYIPIVRTFAPFIAGISRMNFRHFMIYNLIGSAAWILSFILMGFFFGKIPLVRDYASLSLLILGLVFLIVLPVLFRSFLRKEQQ